MLTNQDLADAGRFLTRSHAHHAITLAALLDTTDHLLSAALPGDPRHQRVLRDELIACVLCRCQVVGITPQAVLAARRGLREAQVTLAYLDGLPA